MNAKQYKFDRLKQTEKLNPEQKQTRLMRELQEKLKLYELPYHIECLITLISLVRTLSQDVLFIKG